MTTEIAIILLLDGIANGAIYLLAGLGLVLIFSVTRVVFVPFGDITAFCVLSIAAFELGRVPGTIWIVAILAAIATAIDVASHIRAGEHAKIPRSLPTFRSPISPSISSSFWSTAAGCGIGSRNSSSSPTAPASSGISSSPSP